ncbi:MAG: DUF3575 domain-containing protein [Bacteroidales bacterium]|nr:DUF3575 domain-containing protein [Bacteroidales bacterium]
MKSKLSIRHAIILCIAITYSTLAFGQESIHRKNIIKTNSFALLGKDYNLAYERFFSTKSSLIFSVHYLDNIKFFWSQYQGVYANIGYRFYPTHKLKNTPTGFWISPRIGAAYFVDNYREDEIPKMYYAFVTGEFGYQWALKRGFTIDLGTGFSLLYQKEVRGDRTYRELGGLPSIIIGLGYSF